MSGMASVYPPHHMKLVTNDKVFMADVSDPAWRHIAITKLDRRRKWYICFGCLWGVLLLVVRFVNPFFCEVIEHHMRSCYEHNLFKFYLFYVPCFRQRVPNRFANGANNRADAGWFIKSGVISGHKHPTGRVPG